MDQLTKDVVVAYRVFLAEQPPIKSSRAPRLGPESLQTSQRALRTFFGWTRDDGYTIDERIFRLRKTKIPRREATGFTIARLRLILEACENETERAAVRLLVGSGVRKAEAVGLSFRAADGLSDLGTDSIAAGWAELRVWWDAAAKGRKARRVPIAPGLALALKHARRTHPRRDSTPTPSCRATRATPPAAPRSAPSPR